MTIFGVKHVPETIASSRYIWVILLVVTGLAIAIRFIIPPQFNLVAATDITNYYQSIAENLVRGRGYILHNEFVMDTSNPPLVAILIATDLKLAELFSANPDLFYVSTVFLFMLWSAVSIYRLASPWLPEAYALLGVLFFLTYPLYIWLVQGLNTEIPFIAFFFAALAAFQNRQKVKGTKNDILAGLLLGLAALSRSIGFVLIPVVMIIFFRKDDLAKRLLNATLVLMDWGVVIAPWSFIASQQRGQFILIASNNTASMYDGLTFAIEKQGNHGFIDLPQDVADLQRTIRDKNSVGSSSLSQILFEQFQTNTQAVIKLFTIKAVQSWYASDSARNDTLILLIQIIYGTTISAGIGIALRRSKSERPIFLFTLILFTLYFWAATISVLSIVRYMVPIVSLWAGLAAPFIPYAWKQRQRKTVL